MAMPFAGKDTPPSLDVHRRARHEGPTPEFSTQRREPSPIEQLADGQAPAGQHPLMQVPRRRLLRMHGVHVVECPAGDEPLDRVREPLPTASYLLAIGLEKQQLGRRRTHGMSSVQEHTHHSPGYSSFSRSQWRQTWWPVLISDCVAAATAWGVSSRSSPSASSRLPGAHGQNRRSSNRLSNEAGIIRHCS
ncbi:hypothetical protein VTK73DRAFT_7141 [Phialemonium thermophilum]|uniref:Uncharacterized protein n=1 Tax=Phialemonium thermophilum TaxID=223376 RepID=A0ABR3WG50_9PEZI